MFKSIGDRIIRSGSSIRLFILVLSSIASYSVFAFENPLSEESVREAYFLGRSTDYEKLNHFFEQYVRYPKAAAVGPISLRTPYDQVVLRAWQNWDYNAQQAHIDYEAQRNLMVVSFSLYPHRQYALPVTPTMGANVTKNLVEVDQWNGFRFQVSQNAVIQAKALASRPIFDKNEIIGAEIVLEFDVRQFAPERIKIQIITPEGEIVTSEFNLDKLK
jgi:hypothetical protein